MCEVSGNRGILIQESDNCQQAPGADPRGLNENA